MRYVSRSGWAVLLFASQVSAYRDSLRLEPALSKDVPDVADVAKSTSSPDAMPVLLLWFLVFDFAFLYLSNTTYTLMRDNFFKMVSHTVSIFCALLLEMAVADILLEGTLRLCQMPPEFYDLAYHSILLLLFPVWFLAISYITWKVRDSRESVFAAGGVIAHAAAFTAIDLSARLQMRAANKFDNKATDEMMVIYVASPFLAMFLCKVFSHMSHWVRRKQLMSTMMEQKEVDETGHGPYWAHEAFHCELECCAILSGYLVRQALLILVQQQIPKYSGDIEVPLAAPVIFITTGAVIAAKSFLAALPWKTDLVTFVQLLLGMTACWLFMSFIMYNVKQNVEIADHRWLFLVFSVSGVALLAMFVMGYMADWRMLKKSQLDELIVVCGVATGLAWEKSFAWAVKQVIQDDALTYNYHALRTLRHGSPMLADLAKQMRILEVCAYLAILAVMMPAWRWYIVPLASHH